MLKTALALARAAGELELFERKLSTAIDHHVIDVRDRNWVGLEVT